MKSKERLRDYYRLQESKEKCKTNVKSDPGLDPTPGKKKAAIKENTGKLNEIRIWIVDSITVSHHC